VEYRLSGILLNGRDIWAEPIKSEKYNEYDDSKDIAGSTMILNDGTRFAAETWGESDLLFMDLRVKAEDVPHVQRENYYDYLAAQGIEIQKDYFETISKPDLIDGYLVATLLYKDSDFDILLRNLLESRNKV
jgi:hypothetical protein